MHSLWKRNHTSIVLQYSYTQLSTVGILYKAFKTCFPLTWNVCVPSPRTIRQDEFSSICPWGFLITSLWIYTNQNTWIHISVLHWHHQWWEVRLVPSTAAILDVNINFVQKAKSLKESGRQAHGETHSQEICSRESLHSSGWTSDASRLSPDCPSSAGTQTFPASPVKKNPFNTTDQSCCFWLS